jgi:Holliday junction resolvase RusA-like endonuclease
VDAVAAGRAPRAIVTGDNPQASGWASLVRGQAQTLYEPPFDGAVAVSVVFRLPRPASLPKRVRHCVKKPDVDKLARNVLDGLTGVLFLDDRVVVDLHARKVYTTADLAPGAVITVAEAGEPDPEPLALFVEA